MGGKKPILQDAVNALQERSAEVIDTADQFEVTLFFCKPGDDDADADHDRFSPIPMLQTHRIVYSPRYLVSDPPRFKNWTV